jgi:hypothetical protein
MTKQGSKAWTYVLFGPGRVGRNIASWLESLGHRTSLLSRSDGEDRGRCAKLIAAADVVCAALPDGALAPWKRAWSDDLGTKPAVHFSGALLIDGMWSYHPLYSFPPTVLPFDVTTKIAFARQEGSAPLAEIFPGAKNTDFVVRDQDRAFYHALAVLSGNYAAALWNATATAFARRLGIEPGSILSSYLSGVVDRFSEHPFSSLTGPAARRDRTSVEANLAALDATPELKAAYEAFLALAWPDFRP